MADKLNITFIFHGNRNNYIMKLTDYVIDFLANQGIDTVFGLTGGAVVHFFDSADKHPEMQPVFCHHEQAASMAAPAYAKIKNKPGLCIVTTGPGGTNSITGLTGSWQDSVPCVFISGQTRLSHTSHGKNVRQVGSQELDILSIVEPLTNYAIMLESAESIRYHLEKAIFLSKSGRPGPVWLDIPLDMQWADVDPDLMVSFDPEVEYPSNLCQDYSDSINEFQKMLSVADRPLILAGYGIRLSGAISEFESLLDKLQIPWVSSWAACDLIPTDHNLYLGRCGLAGQRGANLAVQNCDLLIVIGSHLSIPLTGTNFDYFARDAKRIVINIDKNELLNETVKVDLGIVSDVKIFLQKVLGLNLVTNTISNWYKKCLLYKNHNELKIDIDEKSNLVNQYNFLHKLNAQISSNDTIIVDGGGTVVYSTFQIMKIKKNQRILYSGGIGAMGSGLPESVGATFANNKGRIICLVGDGSFQFNIQELQTILHYNLDVKIFVFNNGGYLSIRHTQAEFLNHNFIGSSAKGGMSLPNYQKISNAYKIPSTRATSNHELEDKIQWSLSQPGPVMCEIMIDPSQEIIPSQGFVKNPDGTGFPRPLEDMYPYLDRDEFNDLMIVTPLDVSKNS
jgi:acetolactate synthase I/II/III large subunit